MGEGEEHHDALTVSVGTVRAGCLVRECGMSLVGAGGRALDRLVVASVGMDPLVAAERAAGAHMTLGAKALGQLPGLSTHASSESAREDGGTVGPEAARVSAAHRYATHDRAGNARGDTGRDGRVDPAGGMLASSDVGVCARVGVQDDVWGLVVGCAESGLGGSVGSNDQFLDPGGAATAAAPPPTLTSRDVGGLEWATMAVRAPAAEPSLGGGAWAEAAARGAEAARGGRAAGPVRVRRAALGLGRMRGRARVSSARSQARYGREERCVDERRSADQSEERSPRGGERSVERSKAGLEQVPGAARC